MAASTSRSRPTLRPRRCGAAGDRAVAARRSSFVRDMYWTVAQMVAHHTSNGCNLETGDLIGSGTVSGPGEISWGSLLELTARGSEPIALPSGEKRGFIEDGDEIIFRGFCAKAGYPRIGFGECRAVRAAGAIIPPCAAAKSLDRHPFLQALSGIDFAGIEDCRANRTCRRAPSGIRRRCGPAGRWCRRRRHPCGGRFPALCWCRRSARRSSASCRAARTRCPRTSPEPRVFGSNTYCRTKLPSLRNTCTRLLVRSQT